MIELMTVHLDRPLSCIKRPDITDYLDVPLAFALNLFRLKCIFYCIEKKILLSMSLSICLSFLSVCPLLTCTESACLVCTPVLLPAVGKGKSHSE